MTYTPFGLDGPKADWADERPHRQRRRLAAALMGDRDLPPLRWGAPQAYLHGAADMAVAALVALARAGAIGPGAAGRRLGAGSCLQSSFCYTLNEAWRAPPMGRAGEGVDFGPFSCAGATRPPTAR